MNVITGGTGLIGAHLTLELLKHGEDVRLLIRQERRKEEIRRVFRFYGPEAVQLFHRIQWAMGDVNDIGSLEEAFEGSTNVYHLAGIVSLRNDRYVQMKKVNVEGTANVVNICLQKKLYLCHVSSSAVFGYHPEGIMIHEELYWKGDHHFNCYATTKHDGEMEVWRGIEEGLNAVIVNPCAVLGPGDWDRSSGLAIRRAARAPKYYPPGTKNFVDVRDIAVIMRRLTEKKISGERFLLASDSVTIREMLIHFADAFGHTPPRLAIGRFGLRSIAFIERLFCFLTGKERQLTAPVIASLLSHTRISNEKIKKQLNFSFIPVKESIHFAAQLYRKESGV
ncbi:MAG: NAD-dependent epimerase/dehydratase family protein [Bacteroidia bacterium]|nr:NAD-dependent epimerase/dehydratase family protein [Bacteroidia bacterium]